MFDKKNQDTMVRERRASGSVGDIADLRDFTISLRSGHTEDLVYANGNMQVGVNVTLVAIDESGTQIMLTDAQLNSIQLVDWDTLDSLPGGWNYTQTENEYNHSFPGSPPREASNNPVSDATPQNKVYWVSTSKVESLKIGAKIVLGGTTYSTNSTEHKSSITVTGRQALKFTAANFKVDVKSDVSKGKYYGELYICNNGKKLEDITPEWTQDCVYISLDNVKIKYIYVGGTANDSGKGDADYRNFSYVTMHNNLFWWCLWGDDKDGQSVGPGYMDGKFGGEICIKATATIPVSPHENDNTVNLSLFHFNGDIGFWGKESYRTPHFSVVDTYGNQSGKIVIQLKKYDWGNFTLEDG